MLEEECWNLDLVTYDRQTYDERTVGVGGVTDRLDRPQRTSSVGVDSMTRCGRQCVASRRFYTAMTGGSCVGVTWESFSLV